MRDKCICCGKFISKNYPCRNDNCEENRDRMSHSDYNPDFQT